MHVYLAWAAESSKLVETEKEGEFLTWTFRSCLKSRCLQNTEVKP